MNTSTVDSVLQYSRELVQSGLDGARTALEHDLNGKPAIALLAQSLQKAMVPALIGASFGVLVGCLSPKPRKASTLLLGLTGAIVGMGAAVMTDTRSVTRDVARGAATGIHNARDAHWLKLNPVCYG